MTNLDGDPEISINQQDLRDHSEDKWDAVVAGAGPAGSTTALHLAAAGRRVLLLDSKTFPRDKVCGDALIADTHGALERSGLLEAVSRQAYRVETATVYSPSRLHLSIPGKFMTLKRRKLDAVLAAGAVERGATFCRGKVKSFDVVDGVSVKVWVEGAAEPVPARSLVLATGANRGLLEGSPGWNGGAPSAFAMRCYIRSKAQLDTLLISYDRSILPGYAWIFPMGGDEYNVGCGLFSRRKSELAGNLLQIFEAFCREFPPMRELWDHRVEQGKMKGAPLRCGLRVPPNRPKGPVLVAGETVDSTFPFTGEGIGKAMETGEMAARALNACLEKDDSAALESYWKALERDLAKKYVGYRIAERWLSREWIANFFARRARRSRFLQKAFAGFMNETVDPREVFSVSGILKSYFF
ncbi:MAG: geranylgeranyl reductase family protein [Acidobacteriota bacterium]